MTHSFSIAIYVVVHSVFSAAKFAKSAEVASLCSKIIGTFGPCSCDESARQSDQLCIERFFESVT